MSKAPILCALLALPMIAVGAQSEIPSWIKNNAAWWADGSIDDATFLGAVQFLIGEGIIEVPPTSAEGDGAGAMPEWVKNNAAWWADGSIDDATFIGALQFLIREGIITVGEQETAEEPEAASAPMAETGSMREANTDEELAACEEIRNARDRIECRNEVKDRIKVAWYKENSEVYEVGPITYYYPGLGTDGNAFYMQGDQPILDVTMLAINARGSDNVSLSCTSPSICSYDVYDGSRSFKYTSTDFTSGQHVIKPGQAREFNILFGPNIGYGGTQLEYDPSKSYTFRIAESFGSADVPLNLE